MCLIGFLLTVELPKANEVLREFKTMFMMAQSKFGANRLNSLASVGFEVRIQIS